MPEQVIDQYLREMYGDKAEWYATGYHRLLGRVDDLMTECWHHHKRSDGKLPEPPKYPSNPENTPDGLAAQRECLELLTAYLAMVPRDQRRDYQAAIHERRLQNLRQTYGVATDGDSEKEWPVFICCDVRGDVIGITWTEDAAVIAVEAGNAYRYFRRLVTESIPTQEPLKNNHLYCVEVDSSGAIDSAKNMGGNQFGPHRYAAPEEIDQGKWLVRAENIEAACFRVLKITQPETRALTTTPG